MVFTVGICPINDSISIRFFEWYYFITWTLLDLYFSLTFQKVLRQNQLLLQSAYNLSIHEPRQKLQNSNDQPATPYITPLRQFFGDLPPLHKKDSNETLDGSDIMHLLAERQNRVNRYYSIASWSGFSLGTLIVAYYLFAIYFLYGHEKGLIQSIVISVCIVLVTHFFFGGLGLTPLKWSRNQSLVSIAFGLGYIITLVLAVVLSGDFSIYISAYLWPICTVLVTVDFSRNNADKRMSLIKPNTDKVDSHLETSPESLNLQWTFFRYLALTSLCGSFFISLFSGLYLPLALMIIILVSSISISGYLPSYRWGYFLTVSLSFLLVLMVSCLLAVFVPIFWGRSNQTPSTAFIQKDYSSIVYRDSFTDSQAIYIPFDAAKRKSENYTLLISWLHSLPATRNRIYFDVQDSLYVMKNLGVVSL